MNLLIMTGPLYPQAGNNANLIGKLTACFVSKGHEVRLFSLALQTDERDLPGALFGVPVCWALDNKRDWKRRLLFPAISKVVDPKGFSDALQVQIILRELKKVRRWFPFDAILATSEPFSMACAAVRLRGVKRALYLMDPPARISSGQDTVFRNRVLPLLLKRQDVLVTTPFIARGLEEHDLHVPKKKVIVGFPMIISKSVDRKAETNGKIRLLYCGWLYSDIRSPRYFLDIVSRLDERFEVTFMGKECELLNDRFPIKTKAAIITKSNQPYEAAQQAMADADILINIGNSVPVHMPSKTLEYINTGKPFVNFYKMKDCPTLYYTKRYPLALNLFEEDSDMDSVTKRFVDFCETNLGKTVDHTWIEREYADCTLQYVADQINAVLS